MKINGCKEKIKFVLIGGLGFVFEAVLFKLMIEQFNQVIFVNTLCFSLGVLLNYVLCKYFVFDKNDGAVKQPFLRFILVSGIGLILNDLIVGISIDLLHFDAILSKSYAAGFCMVVNYKLKKEIFVTVKEDRLL